MAPPDGSAWFITFGCGQPLAGCFAWVPEAWTPEQALEKITMVYGERWAFFYGREEYDRVIGHHDVREVAFGEPND